MTCSVSPPKIQQSPTNLHRCDKCVTSDIGIYKQASDSWLVCSFHSHCILQCLTTIGEEGDTRTKKEKGTGRTARAVANDQDLAPCFGPAQLRDMALGISNEGHQTQGPKRVPSGATAALKFVVARRHVPWLCADILRELYSISLNYLGVSSVATNRRKSSVAYGSKSRVP